MNTITQINEDHFSDDEVAAIKNCPDQYVKDFYKQYLQAEALGDIDAADRHATAIRKRCELIGYDTGTQPAEESKEQTRSPFNEWESRMKQAGASLFEHDSDTVPTLVTAYKEVGRSRFVLGDFDLVANTEVFEDLSKSTLYSKYTKSGSKQDQELWTEYVVSEGATKIETVKNTKIAYLGESRIGKFVNAEVSVKIKPFDQILKESMSMNMSMDSTGNKSLTVTADGDDAESLAELLQLGGIRPTTQTGCGCDELAVEEDLSNAPNPRGVDTDTQLNKMSGGVNGPKKQWKREYPGDNPRAVDDNDELAESLENEFKKFDAATAKPVTMESEYRHSEPGEARMREVVVPSFGLSEKEVWEWVDKQEIVTIEDVTVSDSGDKVRVTLYWEVAPDMELIRDLGRSLKNFAEQRQAHVREESACEEEKSGTSNSVEREPKKGEEVLTELDPEEEKKKAAAAKLNAKLGLGMVGETTELGRYAAAVVGENSEPTNPGLEGFRAGYRGYSIERNPYPPQTEEEREWRYGWEEGRGEMLDKTRDSSGPRGELPETDQVNEYFHYQHNDKGQPTRPAHDELARRAKFGKNFLTKYNYGDEYKEKDKYGDVHKIAGPRGKLPESDQDSEGTSYELGEVDVRSIDGSSGTATGYVYSPETDEELDVTVEFEYTPSDNQTNRGPGSNEEVEITRVTTADGGDIPVSDVKWDEANLLGSVDAYLYDKSLPDENDTLRFTESKRSRKKPITESINLLKKLSGLL